MSKKDKTVIVTGASGTAILFNYSQQVSSVEPSSKFSKKMVGTVRRLPSSF
jgi:hypothetical protein